MLLTLRIAIFTISWMSMFWMFTLSGMEAYAADDALVATLLSEKRCAGCELSGINLAGANLIGADLSGANLEGTNLIMATMAQSMYMKESEDLAALIQQHMSTILKGIIFSTKQMTCLSQHHR